VAPVVRGAPPDAPATRHDRASLRSLMGISLRPAHLKRYRDIAWLLWKYGRSDLVTRAGLETVLKEDLEANGHGAPPEAEDLARDLERMGPTFVKLGQLLSTRADLLPAPYLVALGRLQDKVEPFPFADVERIVSAELGVRLSKGFDEFEATPMAAASLGQVHRARLRDGRAVAVKVQRPDVRARVAADLDALEELAALVDGHTDVGARWEFAPMVAEFRRSLMRELDYREEAENLLVLAENVASFARLVVPRPVEGMTTSRVLTMEYLPGSKITDLSPVVLLEMDASGLAEELFGAYLKQILVDGFFHADPHPGNVVLTRDGRLALLDLGMVARVTPRMQDHLLQLVLAVSEGRADDAVSVTIKLGEVRPDFDERTFARSVSSLVAENRDASLRDLHAGTIVLDVTRLAAGSGLRLPPELTMLGKALLNLDEVARVLNPEFNPNAAIQRHASRILQRRLLASVSPANMMGAALEVKELLEQLPARVNKILGRLADEDVRVTLDGIDQKALVAGLQKVANRITLGLVLAALVIGAAMLMQVETPFRLFGYPGLAIVLFLIAAAGGVALIVTILFGDE
jgi:predicted unusual protein kinase regulating ubiquinone biosynthesis (AarF/ABC1/UbiB family)